MNGTLYQVIAPRGGGNVEQFFKTLHGLLRPPLRRLFHGQPHVAFEIGGADGQVRFYVWLQDDQRGLVATLLDAAYPNVELRPVPSDPLSSHEEGYEGVAYVALGRDNFLPLMTRSEGDPLAPLFSLLAKASEGWKIHLSLLVRPKPARWQGSARADAHSLRRGRDGGILFPDKKSPPTKHALERARAIDEKAASFGFDCCLRVRVLARDEAHAGLMLRDAGAALRAHAGWNSLILRKAYRRQACLQDMRARSFGSATPFTLTVPELGALWHLPYSEHPNVEIIRARHLPVPPSVPREGVVIGESTYSGRRSIAISAEDMRRHVHVVGPTGTGKSTLLLNMVDQVLNEGRGLCIIDPKGSLVGQVVARIPRGRANDVVLLTPSTSNMSLGLNPLEFSGDPFERDLVVDQIVSIFHRIYAAYWGPRTADILRNSLLALTWETQPTLYHLVGLLTNESYRKKLLRKINDPFTKSFWDWYESLSDAQKANVTGPVLNKLRDFVTRAPIRRLLCQRTSTFDLHEIMDNHGILLVDLNGGLWGDETASLVGSFLFARLWQATRQRAKIAEHLWHDFTVFIDEFQNYVSGAQNFADALAQARSYRLSMVLAHQHLGQLPRDLQEALLSNARSRVAFAVGQDDARTLAHEFRPLDPEALMNLGRYEFAARISAASETTATFTGRTLSPAKPSDAAAAWEVVEASLRRYGRPADEIDRELIEVFVPDPGPDVPPWDVGGRPRAVP